MSDPRLDPGAGDPGTPPVVVLVPLAGITDPDLAYYYDFSQSQEEFSRAFAALGIRWRWLPVSTATFRAALDELAADGCEPPPLVFNLCDGDDVHDVPGIDVISHLDLLGLAYTGADAGFYRATTSKVDMKRAFDAAGVTTPPWADVTALRDEAAAAAVCTRLGSPLMVKPAVGAGSMGIGLRSVVSDAAGLLEQVERLQEGYRGWDLASGGLYVERYIAGREFTALVVGGSPGGPPARAYPPVEREFHPSLPATERFLSYDRLWEDFRDEAPVAGGENLWEYRPVPRDLAQRIADQSCRAYTAVGGRGYGRVDLRLDTVTGALHVLEVNAQCGLSEDENVTSIGAILRLSGETFPALVREILADALARRPTLSPSRDPVP